MFDIIESEGLLERATVVGERIRARFTELQKQYPVIGDVRGIGAMAAMELVEDPETKKPAGDFAKAFRAKLYENGVVNVGAGTYHNVIRILVPLTIEDETLARGLDIMEETLAAGEQDGQLRLTTAASRQCPPAGGWRDGRHEEDPGGRPDDRALARRRARRRGHARAWAARSSASACSRSTSIPRSIPSSPDNVVAITPSRLSAYGMSGSNRFGAFTKSPLTGIWLEAYCGGTFARTLRETGWDAVVITRGRRQPVHLHVTGEGAQILPAGDLWGKDTRVDRRRDPRPTGQAIVGALHRGGRGEPGEDRLGHARTGPHARAGRAWAPCSAARSSRPSASLRPARSRLETQEQFVETPQGGRQAGAESPATRNYHLYGTPVMVGLVNEAGAFPTDFFTRGVAPHRGHPRGRALDRSGPPSRMTAARRARCAAASA